MTPQRQRGRPLSNTLSESTLRSRARRARLQAVCFSNQPPSDI